MFLRLSEREDVALKRLKANGVDVEGPVEVEEYGVRVTDFELVGAELTSRATVAVRKHCLQVSLNPEVSRILGYMPAHATHMYPGEWTPIVVTAGLGQLTDEQHAELTGLDWLALLHFVPVTVLPD